MKIIGIDPGLSGAIAIIGDSVTVTPLAKLTEHDAARHVAANTDAFAFIEKVGANRGPEGRRQGASSMFTFGQSYGFLRGLLVALEIPFDEVLPQRWQQPFGLIRKNKNETTTQKKNRHKAKSQSLFPSVKITHAVADALLIAEYGRRLRNGELA